MVKHREEKLGEWFGLATVLMYAFWPIGANFIAKQMPPIQFLAYITLLGAVPMFFSTIYLKQFKQLFHAKTLVNLLVYTILLAVIPYVIITYATQFTSAINTGFLTQTEGVYGLILGWLIFKESIDRNKALGFGFIFLANALLIYNGGVELNWANVAIAIAPVSFVVGNVIAKKLQKERVGWAPLLFFRNFVGGLIILLMAVPAEEIALPPAHLIWPILLLGLTVFGLEKIFWQLTLHRMDLSKATAIVITAPVFTFFLAYLLLGEVPDLYQWLAFIFTVVGMVFIMRTHSKQWIQPEQ